MARTKQTAKRAPPKPPPPPKKAAPPPKKMRKPRQKKTIPQLEARRLDKAVKSKRIRSHYIQYMRGVMDLGKRKHYLKRVKKVFKERYKNQPIYLTIKHGRS